MSLILLGCPNNCVLLQNTRFSKYLSLPSRIDRKYYGCKEILWEWSVFLKSTMQRPWPQGPKPESCALIIRPPRTKINLVYFLVEVHQQRSLWPPRIRWRPQQSMSGANQLRPVQRKRRTWRAASHAQDQVWKPWRSRGRKGRGVWGDAVEMAGVSEWHWCLFP